MESGNAACNMKKDVHTDIPTKTGFKLISSPSAMKEKADNILRDIVMLKGSFERVRNISASSKAYWRGESGDSFREALSGFNDEAEEVLSRLKDTIIEVTSAADVSVIVRSNGGESEALPSDVLI